MLGWSPLTAGGVDRPVQFCDRVSERMNMSAIEVRRVRDAVDQASANGLVQALERHQVGVLVALPSERAVDALGVFLESFGVRGATVHTESTTRVPGVGRLGAHRWAVQVPRRTTGAVQQILLHDDWFATSSARDAHSQLSLIHI